MTVAGDSLHCEPTNHGDGMARPLGQQAIVVGAGMGGLAAAAALAPHFERVTILDRDAIPDGADPRMGVGQGAHTHQLLKAGEEALERLLPGLREAFYRAGAVEMRVGRDVTVLDFGGVQEDCDVGFSVTSLSRPVYEKAVRDAVKKLGVRIESETPVRRLAVKDGRCIGVELEDGSVRSADFVVDSTGMAGPLMRQLAEDGHAEFETEEVRINVAYTTGVFEQPEKYKGERRGFFVLPPAPQTHFGLMLPIENNRWILSLGGRGTRISPRDLEGYRAYARELVIPDVYDRIKDARLVGDLKTFRKTTSTRRKVWEAKKWPQRLAPLGDAMSSVNPTYGQGMTVAACQADALAGILNACAEGDGGLDGVARDYLVLAAEFARRAWALSTSSDYAYPETEGPRPENHAMARAIAATLRKLADEDVAFRILRYRLVHMVASESDLREGPMGLRFFTALQGSMAQQA